MKENAHHSELATAQRLDAEGHALRALAMSLLGVAADADDVVQDSHAAALAAPAASVRQLGPWLLGTVRNFAGMLRRAEARRRARERAVALPERDAGSDPATMALQAELMRDVASAVHALEEPFRTVVLLRYWRGLLPEAIAQELGVPRNTVRSRLQRGLERLRVRLDAKYGKRERWAAPLSALLGVRTAATAMTGGGVLVFAGLLMKAKVMIGVAAVLLTAGAISWSLAGEGAGPPTLVSRSPAPSPVVADTALPLSNDRREAPALSPAQPAAKAQQDAAFDSSPAQVAPWLARFLVVDIDEHPVADAVITIWPSKRVQMGEQRRKAHGFSGNAYSGRCEQVLLELDTDRQGRAQATFALESLVASVNKAGIGSTPEVTLWNTTSAAAETKLVLEKQLFLRGCVLRADGSSAESAKVVARVHGFNTMQIGRAPEPDPVVVGADGHFVIPAQKHTDYRLQAELDGKQSFEEQVSVMKQDLGDIVLAFPGAITLDGIVVDANGKPVAGADIAAWREYRLADANWRVDKGERVTAKASAEGRFSIAVRRQARYQLLAAAEGQATSDLQWIETTGPRPHAEVRLVLQTFATIKGRVLRGDGSPFPGVRIVTTPETGERSPDSRVPNQEDLFPKVTSGTAAVDGSFTVIVHPSTTWTLSARPVANNWRLCVKQIGVRPGSDDIVFTLTDAELAGCVVDGTVVGTDGAPLESFYVEIGDYEDGQPKTSGLANLKRNGNHFTCEPLPLGSQFSLQISFGDPDNARGRVDSPLAPARFGPFVTDKATLHFDVHLEPWGALVVRVVEADGTPARRVNVVAHRDVRELNSEPVAQPVDDDGKVTLPRLTPGAHHLRVSKDFDMLVEQAVMIAPGPNHDVVLTLPAKVQAGKKQ